MFKKILVCLDGSGRAEQILPYASEEAIRFSSKVVLLRVVPEPIVMVPGVPGAPGGPVQTRAMLEEARKEMAEAEAYLKQVAQPLRQKGLEVECVTQVGAAGAAIISYADTNGVELIALATHGRSGLGRAVFGSVADYVLRQSGLPMLLIRPQQTET